MKTFADAASSLQGRCRGEEKKTKKNIKSNLKPGKFADTSENAGQLESAVQVRLEVQHFHSCTLSWIVAFLGTCLNEMWFSSTVSGNWTLHLRKGFSHVLHQESEPRFFFYCQNTLQWKM